MCDLCIQIPIAIPSKNNGRCFLKEIPPISIYDKVISRHLTMRAAAFVLHKQSVFGALRRTFCIYSLSPINLRNFCSQISPEAAETSSEIGKEAKLEESKSLSSRIEKLYRGESVVSAFQSWMGDGLPIHRGDIFHTINRLRRLKSTKRALEVSYSVLSTPSSCLMKCFTLF